MNRFLLSLLAAFAASEIVDAADSPPARGELVFPPQRQANHAPGIVECPNGDFIVSWYRRSGASGGDVAVHGARKRSGETGWSADFVMVDTPGFPDGNTCMMIDAENRLWLFWPVMVANTSESALTNYLLARDYTGDGPPKWEWQGVIYLKPADFSAEFQQATMTWRKAREELAARLSAADREQLRGRESRRRLPSPEAIAARIDDMMFQRMGWHVRCKPTLLPPSSKHPNGRILLPLYTDTFSLGIMAISDDKGRTWSASKPIIGDGAIQPTVLARRDGTLVAYMRDNGGSGHVKVSESTDDGETWGEVVLSELPNPGAGIDGIRLANGHFCLVYNDTQSGRNSLAVSISEDEGRTWKYTRHLEHHATGAYQDPCLIQGRDLTLHAVYSYFVPGTTGTELSSIKHVEFHEDWVTTGSMPQR
jgi:predicted neuraminidase